MDVSPLHGIAPFSAERRAMRILLVDDNEAMVELSATFLERELDDVETETYTEPGPALDELTDGEYDCVVSDYDMPGMDGLELLTAARERGIDLPFVLFTGKGSEEIASRAISAGVDEYLQKGGPEEYPVLANKVSNLVEKYWAETHMRRGFLAIESAEEGIGIIDDEGVYQYLNEAYAALYDRDRAELIGEHWDVLYPADEARRFHDEILPQLEAEGSWRGFSTGVTKGGEAVPERLVLTQMDDGGHVCIVQELTEVDALRAEVELKDRVLDAVGVGVVVTDPSLPDNPVVYANEAFETLTGYDAESVTGRNCRFLYGPETDPETVAAIRAAADAGEPISTEIRIYDAGGEPVRARLDSHPIRDDDGAVEFVVGFYRPADVDGAGDAFSS
ncbi:MULTISPECIES: PAS domain-containing protein [Haloferax]|uniref:Blue-light photoreceptor n=1 Tax=Haloferax massiliensis TaxID=1476858 RepID=A0A0D6JLI9_9EURY|nr:MULTISPECIES: PAS domain-containing protein [Haloferax]MDS0242892.1 PAS domain-containing protein [Haloferax sp. S2CR25]MDS0446013.1 PAS domain-containing protein [Haloferax sp. S2CR25-2]CQR48777.1 Blue-light photoreceptor [Haloferax massiliensis]